MNFALDSVVCLFRGNFIRVLLRMLLEPWLSKLLESCQSE